MLCSACLSIWLLLFSIHSAHEFYSFGLICSFPAHKLLRKSRKFFTVPEKLFPEESVVRWKCCTPFHCAFGPLKTTRTPFPELWMWLLLLDVKSLALEKICVQIGCDVGWIRRLSYPESQW